MLTHSASYVPGSSVTVNGSAVSIGCRTTYSLPSLASTNPVELNSPRGSISIRFRRSASRTVSPIAQRAASNVSNGMGPRTDRSGGSTPPMMPKSMRIGWWSRTNDFQAQSASARPGGA